MKTHESHSTSGQMQELLDGRLNEHDADLVRAHLRECESCRLAYADLRSVDATLRRIPLRDPGKDFTARVMQRIELSPGAHAAYKLVEGIAYLFALMIVAAFVLLACVLTGAISVEQVVVGQTAVQRMASSSLTEIGSGTQAFVTWLGHFIPVSSGRSGLEISLLGILVLGTLAVVDWIVQKQMSQRTH